MNFQGVIIGFISFFIIGVFHPIVIKAEFLVGKKIWPVFLIVGLSLIMLSLLISNSIIACIIGVTGFTSLWSIHEVIEQEERVRKGWFPSNPKK